MPLVIEEACYGVTQACALRVTRLATTGAPAPGETGLYVTEGLVAVETTPDVETGDEFTQKTGCGTICHSLRTQDKVKRQNLVTELCSFEAELIELLTGGSLITSGGTTIGVEFPHADAPDSAGVGLEAWSRAWDGDQQAVVGDDLLWWLTVWPKASFRKDTERVENGIMVQRLVGTGERNTQWPAGGPEGDYPDGVAVTNYARFLTTAFPEAACGYQTLVAVGS